MSRIIGIHHRVKKTAEGEARPTLLGIHEGENVRSLALDTETDELDFLLGRFPVAHRKATEEDNVSDFRPHQCVLRKLKRGENEDAFPHHHILRTGKEVYLLTQVPTQFDGLRPGDRVLMLFGGSGDRFAYALSNQGQEIGADVFRIPSFRFMEFRPESEKDNTEHDQLLLPRVYIAHPELFQKVEARDRAVIQVKMAVESRLDQVKDRIACGNRLRARLIGKIFLNPEGRYPEGAIEDLFDEAKANDFAYQAHLAEEARRTKDLEKAVSELEIWNRFFKPLEGVGPVIAGEIIAAIGDIRRFATSAKLKRYLGVHVRSGGEFGDTSSERQFPRRRHGEVANWNALGRQALYKFADQWNRRPDSVWGQKLRAYKTKFREQHPEVDIVNGKKRYTDAHIHKMAVWRTITKFVEHLHKEWWRIEKKSL